MYSFAIVSCITNAPATWLRPYVEAAREAEQWSKRAVEGTSRAGATGVKPAKDTPSKFGSEFREATKPHEQQRIPSARLRTCSSTD